MFRITKCPFGTTKSLHTTFGLFYPTMKPVKLFMRLIKNSSKEEDLVLDPFGGSGTTIIASQRLKRVARVMELDPHYCDVIRRRWTKWCHENGVEPGEGALE